MVATNTSFAIPDFSLSPRIDQVGVEERAKRFTARSIKAETKVNYLMLTLNMIDLTTLEGKDSEGKVKQLCYKAQHLHDAYPGLPTVAAVCVSKYGRYCKSIGQ
jgi:deoxyribose-phosphate aldolase